jgi:hypothetical protein
MKSNHVPDARLATPEEQCRAGANLFNDAVMAESLADERGGRGRHLRGC